MINQKLNYCCSCNKSLFTVISGSFRKHLPQMISLKHFFEKHEIGVLSPSGDAAINADEEFIILDSDPISDPRLLQDSVFLKIKRSSFLAVANIGGYLGKAAVLEIGYAIACGVSIYTLEPIEDPNIAPYCRLLEEVFPEVRLLSLNVNKIDNFSNIVCCDAKY